MQRQLSCFESPPKKKIIHRKGNKIYIFFLSLHQKMAKQTLVFESAKELSLNNGMMVITDKITGEITLKSLEDIQMIMVDNHSVRITGGSVPAVINCWSTATPVRHGGGRRTYSLCDRTQFHSQAHCCSYAIEG